MKTFSTLFLAFFVSSNAFHHIVRSRFSLSTTATRLNIIAGDSEDVVDKMNRILQDENAPKFDADFDKTIKSIFPYALTNQELETGVASILSNKGFTSANTLLATSLCSDELALCRLEENFVKIYGNNFNLGDLSGFPFDGETGFGALPSHIPDDGYCLILYGPHVGITKNGIVGKVERDGIELDLVDDCCGSAVAASRYVQEIIEGSGTIQTNIPKFDYFQQGLLQELILSHGKKLANADNRMVILPYALYESQDILMQELIAEGISATKKGVALLGGIQINTGPDTVDYFHPLRFDFMDNNKGEIVEDMLSNIQDHFYWDYKEDRAPNFESMEGWGEAYDQIHNKKEKIVKDTIPRRSYWEYEDGRGPNFELRFDGKD